MDAVVQGHFGACLDASSCADAPQLRSDGGVTLDEPSLSAAEEVVAVNVSWLTASSANHFGLGGKEGLAEVELRQCRVLGRSEPQSWIFGWTGLQPRISVSVGEAAKQCAVTRT